MRSHAGRDQTKYDAAECENGPSECENRIGKSCQDWHWLPVISVAKRGWPGLESSEAPVRRKPGLPKTSAQATRKVAFDATRHSSLFQKSLGRLETAAMLRGKVFFALALVILGKRFVRGLMVGIELERAIQPP